MERESEQADEQATSVQDSTGRPPDEGLAYDPVMTDSDEANLPRESDADPTRGPGEVERGDADREEGGAQG